MCAECQEVLAPAPVRSRSVPRPPADVRSLPRSASAGHAFRIRKLQPSLILLPPQARARQRT